MKDCAQILYFAKVFLPFDKMHEECICTSVRDTFVCLCRMAPSLLWKWCRHFSDVCSPLCERFQLKKFAFVQNIYWITHKRNLLLIFRAANERAEPLWMFVLKNQLMIQWPFPSFQLNFATENEWIFSDVFIPSLKKKTFFLRENHSNEITTFVILF